jgi:hypothetical protein
MWLDASLARKRSGPSSSSACAAWPRTACAEIQATWSGLWSQPLVVLGKRLGASALTRIPREPPWSASSRGEGDDTGFAHTVAGQRVAVEADHGGRRGDVHRRTQPQPAIFGRGNLHGRAPPKIASAPSRNGVIAGPIKH